MNRLFALAESIKQRFVTEVVVTEAETAFLFVDGTFREILKPGRHRLRSPERTRVERVTNDDPRVRFADIAAIYESPAVARATTHVRIEEGHLGLGFRNGVFFTFLAPGLHVFAGDRATRGYDFVTVAKTPGAELVHPAEATIASHPEASAHLRVVRVEAGTLGLLYVDGVLARPLAPGRHALLETGHALRVDTAKPFEPVAAPDRAALLAQEGLVGRLVVAEVKDDERGLVFAGDNFRRFLSPGTHVFLRTTAPETRVTIVRTSKEAFTHPALAAIRRSPDAGAFLTTFNVGQGHAGLLFVDGEHQGRLAPGSYSYFNGERHVHVELVDLRELGAEVSGQELLTQDKVSLRLNVSVRYRIVDPEKAVLAHAGYADAFHRILQLALREETQTATFDDLVSRKDDLGKSLVARAAEGARTLGIEVVSAGLRDVILPGEMRTILNQVVEAERRAQANLVTRREEVAATRSLLNTARLLDENPTLLRLKELEYAERIAEKIGNLSVVGGIDAIVPKIREALGEKKSVSALRLSALDVSPIAEGESARDALAATVTTARHVETLGYTRYWVAEHHNAGALACPSPEVLVAHLLASTGRMRIGSGGVMLPNHAPLRVAETFRVLHALHPGRVDLGIGRAPGTDKRTAALLRRNTEADYSGAFDELQRFFVDEPIPRAPFATTVVAIPVGVPAPDMFVLGTSVESATFAAKRGLGYAYAHHISPADVEAALVAYRAAFVPSSTLSAPHAIVAVATAVSDDEGTARAIRHTAQVSALRFARGERDVPMPTLASAAGHTFDDEETQILAAYGDRAFFGRTDDVAPRLRELVARTGADELMVMTSVAPRELQLASHTSLARALA